jgi:hypothetical protein
MAAPEPRPKNPARAATNNRPSSGTKSEVRAPEAVLTELNGRYRRTVSARFRLPGIDAAVAATCVGTPPFSIEEHIIGVAAAYQVGDRASAVRIEHNQARGIVGYDPDNGLRTVERHGENSSGNPADARSPSACRRPC